MIFFGIVLHAPISVALGSAFPDYALLVKAWKELLMLVLGIPALILVTRHKLWPTLWQSTLVRLMTVYVLLLLVLAFFSGHGTLATVAGLMIDLRFVAFFLLSYVFALIEPRAPRWALKAVSAGAVLVVGFGLLQIAVLPDDILTRIGYGNDTITPYSTIDKNPDFVRINSTLRGPNPLGAFMVILLGLISAWWIRHRRDLTQRQYLLLVLIIASVVAVLFATYSRSAYLGAIIAVLAVGAAMIQRISRKWLYGLAVAAVIVGSGLVVIQQTDWYANVIMHEDPESKVVRKSNSEHVRSLKESYTSALRTPLGSGIGSTGSASLYADNTKPTVVENYFLFVARESGWLGLALFSAITIVSLVNLWTLRRNWQATGLFASGLAMAVIGLLLPVWVDDTVALVWWGLTGVILAHAGR